MCELSKLNNNKTKKAIKTLKTICTKIRSTSDYQKHSVDRIPIQYKGEYKKLFKGLEDDIELDIELKEKTCNRVQGSFILILKQKEPFMWLLLLMIILKLIK